MIDASHRAKHRSIAVGVKCEIGVLHQVRSKLHGSDRVTGLEQRVNKEIEENIVDVFEILFLETGYKQHKAGSVMAKQHALTPIHVVQVRVPTT